MPAWGIDPTKNKTKNILVSGREEMGIAVLSAFLDQDSLSTETLNAVHGSHLLLPKMSFCPSLSPSSRNPSWIIPILNHFSHTSTPITLTLHHSFGIYYLLLKFISYIYTSRHIYTSISIYTCTHIHMYFHHQTVGAKREETMSDLLTTRAPTPRSPLQGLGVAQSSLEVKTQNSKLELLRFSPRSAIHLRANSR